MVIPASASVSLMELERLGCDIKGNGVHQFFLGDIPHIRSAHPDAAALHIEEPVDKVCQRGFAAGGAYKSHGLSRLNVQRNALDDLGFSVIAEMHIL